MTCIVEGKGNSTNTMAKGMIVKVNRGQLGKGRGLLVQCVRSSTRRKIRVHREREAGTNQKLNEMY